MKQNHMFLVNAKVFTMDDKHPLSQAIEITGEKIKSLSHTGSARAWAGSAAIIDCKGRTVLPGFIDAHQHFVSFAKSLIVPGLGKKYVKSIQDIKEIIRKAAETTPPGTWIRATGYHVYDLEDKRNPTKWDLDSVTTSHPVVLTHSTGYINVLNSTGLAKINIGPQTVSPEGGSIERDAASGQPNGILFGMRAYIAKFIPEIDDRQIAGAVKVISEKLVAMGITSVQDASIQNGQKQWKEFISFRDSGILKPRITMMMGSGPFMEGQYKDITGEDSRLRINGVKVVLHEASGEMHPAKKELHDIILEIHKSGRQAAIHAIEEHVIRAAAEAIKYAMAKYPGPDHRHRIEHCSVCPPLLARKLTNLGIVAVTQPDFIYFNGDRYLNTVPPDQMKYLYPIKTLMDAGVVVAAGSDGPVVAQDPLTGICGAVARLTEQGKRLALGQKISLDRAIKMYTLNAAFAAFEEREKGSIAPGKLADLVVLDRDLEQAKPEEIKDVRVEMVIIGGEVVYQR